MNQDNNLQQPLKIKTFAIEIGRLNNIIVELILRNLGEDGTVYTLKELIDMAIEIRDKLNAYEEQPTIKYTIPQP